MKSAWLVFSFVLFIGVFTCFQKAAFSQENFQLEFISPKDGDEIPSRGMGVTPLACEGKILGEFSEGLRVKVRLLTDKWYDQGIVKVKPNGSWRVDPIYLSGYEHVIEAQLTNQQDEVLGTKTIKVYRIHGEMPLKPEVGASGEYQIEFVSPKNGEEVSALGEVTPIPCLGKVIGAKLSGLKVKVRIFTSQWYDQGVASVSADGFWKIDPIHLGSHEHQIEAQLLDSEGKVIATKSIIVKRKQGGESVSPKDKKEGRLQLEIISPKDGAKISGRGLTVTTIACRGKVSGKRPPSLTVQVRIFTDQWYPQGAATVGADGLWKIEPIYLGGQEHIIETQVLDKDKKVLASKSIKVFRIQ
jgi:hypothetical protein